MRILSVCLIFAGLLTGQSYDLLLKGGHVSDPANNIDRVKDVALIGLYVTPGLIDMHTHVYTRGRASTLFPDDTSLVAGSTTVVDAGVSGWRNFDDFKKTIIDKSQTRVLAF